MDAAAYLDRIGYRGRVAPDRDTLGGLHRAHMLAVPFENLDIHGKREIVLDEERLFDKIVSRRRGGFCYELNGLFAALLREIGFHVEMLSAGVAREAGGFGPEFDHMSLLVELESRWLADVGFGESSLDPLPFDGISTSEYRLSEDGGQWTMFRGAKPQYRFTLMPHELADYAGMCRYHQTSPESSFTKSRLITRATAEGRITLTDTRLILTRGGEREERAVKGPDHFQTLCAEYFGVSALKG